MLKKLLLSVVALLAVFAIAGCGADKPKDSADNKLIADIHYYGNSKQSNADVINAAYSNFTSKGIPVIVGEYGCFGKYR